MDTVTLVQFNDFREKVQGRFHNLALEISEISSYKMPSNWTAKLDMLFNQVAEIRADLENLKFKIRGLDLEGRFIENFTDEEIQNYYLNSGLSLKDIMFKFNCEKASASHFSRGMVLGTTAKGLQLRSQLGQWFRQKALEYANKNLEDLHAKVGK